MNRSCQSKITVTEFQTMFTKDFQEFLDKNLDKEYSYIDYPNSPCFIAEYKLFGKFIDNYVYPKELGYSIDERLSRIPISEDILSFEKWEKSIRPLNEWVRYVSINLLHPNKMLSNTRTTDRVKLRICISKLNTLHKNLDLSSDITDELFYNLIELYYIRKKVYIEYYYQRILQLPF